MLFAQSSGVRLGAAVINGAWILIVLVAESSSDDSAGAVALRAYLCRGKKRGGEIRKVSNFISYIAQCPLQTGTLIHVTCVQSTY